jgi:hypothetical protein
MAIENRDAQKSGAWPSWMMPGAKPRRRKQQPLLERGARSRYISRLEG